MIYMLLHHPHFFQELLILPIIKHLSQIHKRSVIGGGQHHLTVLVNDTAVASAAKTACPDDVTHRSLSLPGHKKACSLTVPV